MGTNHLFSQLSMSYIPINLNGNSSSPVIKFGYGRNSGWFELEVEKSGEYIIEPNGGPSRAVVGDQIRDIYSPGEVGIEYEVFIKRFPRPDDDGSDIALSITENGGVQSISGNLKQLRSIGNGITDTITATGLGITTNLDISGEIRDSGNDAQIYVGFAKGSVGYSCDNSILSRIENANTSMLPIFTNYFDSLSSGIYARNQDCWVFNLSDKLTCISPWNSYGSNTRAGTLVTPRHAIGAAHYMKPEGAEIIFVTSDNEVISRTIQKRIKLPGGTVNDGNFALYLLNEDLPETIIPCKILPQNWKQYLPSNINRIGALCLDKEEKALVTDGFNMNVVAKFSVPNQEDKEILYEDKISGDSGNPAFLILDNELICLTAWTWGGAGSGSSLVYNKDKINSAIDSLDALANISTGYSLTEFDLSNWPNHVEKNYIIENSDIDNANVNLWTENGLINSKMSYVMHESSNSGWILEWTGSSWQTSDFGNPNVEHPNDSSSDDVATPNLATFSNLNFENP